METNEKKVLLSLRNVEVKFNVRGRILTAIRNVSLDVYENESLAIVGESGSGKSVLTKTFAGMLETNGFISNGTILLADDDIAQTEVKLTPFNRRLLTYLTNMLNKLSVQERGAKDYKAYLEKKREIQAAQALSQDEEADYTARIKALTDDIVDKNNYLQTLDRRSKEDQAEIEKTTVKIKTLTTSKEALIKERDDIVASRKKSYSSDAARQAADKEMLAKLKASVAQKNATPDKAGNPYSLSDEVLERNQKIAYEILLSIGRYPLKDQFKFIYKMRKAFALAMKTGEDLNDPEVLNRIFETAAFRVEYRSLDEEKGILHGYAIIDCAKIKYTKDWQMIRGRRIATVFQDPMTSLNPIIPIGKQIMTVILKHQQCSQEEAKKRTLDIMEKVGIPEPAKRFDDYPFEYSGGMRQRIVIAIALSCQPKILICDEPTTALDVTIQAQILDLLRKLKDQINSSIMLITHDLGVIAEMADYVVVMYAGRIVEKGTADDIFHHPAHPYTIGLMASKPVVGREVEKLFSIPGKVPNPINMPDYCYFRDRCDRRLGCCDGEYPCEISISETHKVSCYRFYEEHKAEAAADGKDDMTAFGMGEVSA